MSYYYNCRRSSILKFTFSENITNQNYPIYTNNLQMFLRFDLRLKVTPPPPPHLLLFSILLTTLLNFNVFIFQFLKFYISSISKHPWLLHGTPINKRFASRKKYICRRNKVWKSHFREKLKRVPAKPTPNDFAPQGLKHLTYFLLTFSICESQIYACFTLRFARVCRKWNFFVSLMVRL